MQWQHYSWEYFPGQTEELGPKIISILVILGLAETINHRTNWYLGSTRGNQVTETYYPKTSLIKKCHSNVCHLSCHYNPWCWGEAIYKRCQPKTLATCRGQVERVFLFSFFLPFFSTTGALVVVAVYPPTPLHPLTQHFAQKPINL